MTTLHTHKTETFYQKVLKQEMSSTSNYVWQRECLQTTEEMQQEVTWRADELAYALEIRLTDEQLAIIEADLKSGITLAYVGSGAADEKIAEAIQDAYDDVGNCNHVAVIDHDDIVIVRQLLDKVASGKSLDKGDRVWAGIGAQYLKAGELETPIQRHARFLVHKERREEGQSSDNFANAILTEGA
jgi:hypothetical protein